MKIKSIIIISLIILISSVCNTAMAASPAQIEEAIEDGVAWLASQQYPSGYWQDPLKGCPAGVTGLALVKLQERAFELGYTPFDPCYAYEPNVVKGLEYLFSTMDIISISTQPAGNPDTDGDGNGVYVNASQLTYETGIAMMAIAASRSPEKLVDSPGSPVDGWTYKEVLVDMVDYMAFGQCDSGSNRGGWGYYHCNNSGGTPDNSVSGYAVSGLGYASSPRYGFNCAIPYFVKEQLKNWIDYIQNDDGGDDDGGSGYDSPDYLVNILKTGNLIFQMTFAGIPPEYPDMQRALDYIGRKWNDPSMDPGWGYGGTPHYQAVYAATNGLCYSNINTIMVGMEETDWYADFTDAIVAAQEDDGYWLSDPRGGSVLATEWALIALEMPTSGPLPGLMFIKIDDVNNDDCVVPGREITYTIHYNYPAGPNAPDINDVNIIDELPAEVEFLSASGGGSYDSYSHTVTWSLGSLHPEDAGSFTVTVEVENPQPGSIITNSCEIRSGDQILYTDYEYTSVCCPSLTKVDDVNECIDPCDNITYTICYDADGYSGTDVNIVDTLPSEVDYVSSAPAGEYDDVSHTVTWDIGTLEPNDVCCITLTVAAPNPQSESIITNSCEIKSDGQTLDTAYEYTYVCPWPTLTKVDNITNCVGPGDKITYTICYNSNGRNDTDVALIDELPPGVEFESASHGGDYDPGPPRVVTWLIDQIDPNEPNGICVTLTVDVNCVEPNSIITNCCEITIDEEVLITACEYTPVCPGPTLTKVDNVPDDSYASAGCIITYTICYDANGYGGTDVNFVDTLPAEVNYSSSDPCGYYDADSHTVTWYIGALGLNDACCVELKVKVKDDAPGGIITNCCEVTDYCIDINACESTKYFGIKAEPINPDPRDKMRDVILWPILKWTPGRYVQEVNEHQVYLGTSWAEVNNATTSTEVIYRGEVDVNWYDPYADFGVPLSFNTIYYWRIDEVNDACDASPWKGAVWRFKTANFLVVEDFDSYTDSFALQALWVPDGNSGANPSLETAKVKAGQSMKYEYVDTGFYNYYSEVDADVCDLPSGIGTDWTIVGVEALTLYFHGDPNNDTNEPMYVRLADANINATVTYGDYGEDTNNVNKPGWHEWNIALTDFADVNQNNIKQITIGFGDKDGPDVEGTVYFDDIRLYAPRCVPEYAGDLTGDCVVDYWDLKVMIDEWLDTSNCFAADIYRDCKADFKDFAVLADYWLAEGQIWPEPDTP